MWYRTPDVILMVSLQPDENIIMTSDAKYHGTHGKLYLTNRKLAFEYEKKGFIFEGQYSPLDLPLERISDVGVVGAGPFKKLVVNLVRDVVSFGLPRHEFNVSNPEMWKAKIDVAKSEPETEKAPVKEQEVIVKEVIKIRCSYCHALADETVSKCPNCGANLEP